jgi:hypothetical protein
MRRLALPPPPPPRRRARCRATPPAPRRPDAAAIPLGMIHHRTCSSVAISSPAVLRAPVHYHPRDSRGPAAAGRPRVRRARRQAALPGGRVRLRGRAGPGNAADGTEAQVRRPQAGKSRARRIRTPRRPRPSPARRAVPAGGRVRARQRRAQAMARPTALPQTPRVPQYDARPVRRRAGSSGPPALPRPRRAASRGSCRDRRRDRA